MSFRDKVVCSREQYGEAVLDPHPNTLLTELCLYRRFNVYVAQPEVKPGCVLRRSNWSVLEKRELITEDQVNKYLKKLGTIR